MSYVIVSSKGQVVIPAKIRAIYGIENGTKLSIEQKKEGLMLISVTEAYFEKMAGVLKTKGRLSKKLLKERKAAKKKEK